MGLHCPELGLRMEKRMDKTIYKPKPNSQGMPYISPPHQLSKYPFSQGRFGFHSEPKSRRMEAQYLQREVRWTPTPKVIFVPHIIPNNSARYCSTQLCLYEKLWLGHKSTALPPRRGGVRRLVVTFFTKAFGHDCTPSLTHTCIINMYCVHAHSPHY